MPDMNEELKRDAHKYNLFSAVQTLLQIVDPQIEEETIHERDPVRMMFRVDPSLGFPTSEISQITVQENEGSPHYEVSVNFLGLQGSSSPLPGYMAEAALWSRDADGIQQEFNDFFSNRLIWLAYRIMRKYRYDIRYRSGGEDIFSNWLFSLFGVGDANLRARTNLPWVKLLSFLGLFASQSRSAEMVAAVVAHSFDLESVHVEQFQPRVVPISKRQQNRLGRQNAVLGQDSVIGANSSSINSKITIVIDGLSFDEYRRYLPNGDIFPMLLNMLNFVLRDPLACDLRLIMDHKEIPAWSLNNPQSTHLGWTAFLGGAGQNLRRETTIMARG